MDAANLSAALLTGAGPIEPSWLHTAGQIAGVALMIELLLALVIFLALMVGLAFGAWWLHRNVIPVVGQYSEVAQTYVATAEQQVDRVAHGVASFHGAREGILAGVKAFFMPAPRPAPPTRPLTPTPTPPTGGEQPRPVAATRPVAAAAAAEEPQRGWGGAPAFTQASQPTADSALTVAPQDQPADAPRAERATTTTSASALWTLTPTHPAATGEQQPAIHFEFPHTFRAGGQPAGRVAGRVCGRRAA